MRSEQALLGEMGMSASQVQICMKELQFLHVGSAKSSLQAVRKKYQSSRFSAAHPYIMSLM